MLDATEQIDIEQFVSALRKDYKSLSNRIRELKHSVKCERDGVTLRLHFPATERGKTKISELVNAILDYMTTFALPRSQIEALETSYKKISAEEYRKRCERLQREAISLFIRAQKSTKRNGEAGELLLYILTEWILNAPQILAKMGLKTNRNMPVHGIDGIHVGYLSERKSLCLYWGESKLFEDVDAAITQAAKSIGKALKPNNMDHEISLVARHIDSAGLSPDAKSLLLSFLDPYEGENYNKRIDVVTCLIGFDYDAYAKLKIQDGEEKFKSLAVTKLRDLAPKFSKALKTAGVQNQLVEVFFFPVPSVKELRELFQARIGWDHAPGSR